LKTPASAGKKKVEAPCFSRGEPDFSPAEIASYLKRALALGIFVASAKARIIICDALPQGLKALLPRLKSGAST
jgi:hypothetical protein